MAGMATPPPARPAAPPRPQPTIGTASPTAPPISPPKPKPEPNLDRRTLLAAGRFGILLRNGQTWQRVKLLETDQGRVLLPKHAVDAYLLGPA